jgi:hypothetical protein
MRKLLILLLLLPSLLYAQRQATGNLTIFSEDGDQFYLVLNGEKQNTVAQTNLRVEELPQPYYTAKIIFADSSIPAISKNNLYIASSDGVMQDVTYKIRKDKSGKAKLGYYSMIDVEPGFQPASNVYVHRYGRRDHNDGVTHTTTTTSTSAPVAASINVNGVSMNVSINDPLYNESTTTTTTTTHSNSNHNTNNNSNSNRNSSSRRCPDGFAMRSSDFTAAKKSISDANFDESKISTAKSIAGSNCLSSAQVAEICTLFSFEESKLEFAKFAYKRSTDPQNYFKVNSVFSFDSSKEELNKYVSE